MEHDNLTRAEFRTHIRNKTLRLAFVGMSNCGKSYRSRILANEDDFFWHHVDGEIQKQLGFSDMSSISSWLGYPNTSTYRERERAYLEAENITTKVAELDTHGKNLVFDTTGSVIYLDADTHAWLKAQCLVVNIDVGEEAVSAMLEKFIAEPKPVIWDNMFDPQPGETERDTIARCYPRLLHDRLARYRALAHMTIPAGALRDATTSHTLDTIESCLPL